MSLRYGGNDDEDFPSAQDQLRQESKYADDVNALKVDKGEKLEIDRQTKKKQWSWEELLEKDWKVHLGWIGNVAMNAFEIDASEYWNSWDEVQKLIQMS